jgi:hypothetical protein
MDGTGRAEGSIAGLANYDKVRWKDKELPA